MRAITAAAAALWLAACQTVSGPTLPRSAGGIDVIYVPTPMATVEAMLALAQVGPGDVVYDLGSGDGRIPIEAARRYGARGVGIDISPARIAEARANAKAAGVERRVRFRRQDLFTADIQDATVVTLYLLPALNERLKPRLLSELRPGARIVSHVWDMGSWAPENTVDVADGFQIHLWRVPSTASQETRARP
jgi:SAM-dependent methyltransferase